MFDYDNLPIPDLARGHMCGILFIKCAAAIIMIQMLVPGKLAIFLLVVLCTVFQYITAYLVLMN